MRGPRFLASNKYPMVLLCFKVFETQRKEVRLIARSESKSKSVVVAVRAPRVESSISALWMAERRVSGLNGPPVLLGDCGLEYPGAMAGMARPGGYAGSRQAGAPLLVLPSRGVVAAVLGRPGGCRGSTDLAARAVCAAQRKSAANEARAVRPARAISPPPTAG